MGSPPQAVRPADRPVPGHRVPARRHGHRAGGGGAADPSRRRTAGLWHDDRRGRGDGEAVRVGDAGPDHRRRGADLRRHGPDGRAAGGALVAGRPGRADLGRDERDPAAHHRPLAAATVRSVTLAYEEVRAVAEGQTLVVTLDRPKANAIDVTTSRALYAAFDRLRRDPRLRVAILTGARENISCAGWDLNAAAAVDGIDPPHGPGGFAGLTEFFDIGKPVIAAVNGLA